MSVVDYTAFGALIVAVIGLTVRVSFVLNKKVSYDSLDRCKREVTENFVSKDVFLISHNTMKEDIVEIKKDVKELLKRRNGGVHS